MSDDKKTRDDRDRSKTDSNDPIEIAHIQNQFPGLDRNTITDAIRQYGPGREAILNFLKTKQN